MSSAAEARPSRSLHVAGPRAARAAAGIVLIVHGLIHLIGVALLWRLGQPGQLRYADAHPAPGSAAGLAAGSLWLVAGALFITAAMLLVTRRPAWRPVCVIAVLVSAPVLAMSASVAAAGLAIDAAVVMAVITSLRRKTP